MEKVIDYAPQETDNTKKVRQSNFELLRIICMILIIAHHFSVHSVLSENASGFNTFIYNAFAIGGKVAVNVFVLISGYFIVKSKFKLQKLLLLILQTLFYSFVIYMLFWMFGFYDFKLSEFSNYLFSFYNQYWFMTNYLILYAFVPFLNKIIHNSNKKELMLLILIAIVLQSSILNVDLGNFVWFCTLYLIAGYIRIYPDKYSNSFKLCFIISTLAFLIILFRYTFANVSIWGLKNITCIIFAIALFCVFKNINIKNIKAINLISSTSLGIYLIHDNPIIRPLLWNKWLNVNHYSQNKHFWIFAIGSVAIVFVICCVIELVRSFVEKYVLKLINKRNQKKPRVNE